MVVGLELPNHPERKEPRLSTSPSPTQQDDRDVVIAALQATAGQPSKSPWGPEDEIGMLNLVTPESIASVLAEVDAHKVFDMAVDYFVGMPSWTDYGDPPYSFWMTATPRGGIVDDVADVGAETMRETSRSSDAFSMFTHIGTHVDTLNHFGYAGKVWNCFDMDDHLGSMHWHVGGAERQPPVIARGVLIDVAGAHGVEVLPNSYQIDAAELQGVLQAQGSEVRPGDVVMVNTGRISVWPDRDRFLPEEPGINLDGARFLAEAGAIMVGADNVGLEAELPKDGPFHPVHTYLLAECGVPIMEIAKLDELAAEKVYEFAFIGACMKLTGATGAPMRPIALPLRG